MEYLKEFQAFAGRFSAAADERLHRIDGGTYNEFFRLYSRRWPTTVRSVPVRTLIEKAPYSCATQGFMINTLSKLHSSKHEEMSLFANTRILWRSSGI